MGKLILKLIFISFGLANGAALSVISTVIYLHGINKLDQEVVMCFCINSSIWILCALSYMLGNIIDNTNKDNKNK